MATYDAKTAEVHVLTEKEGMLSAMAHDLEIAVTAFTAKVEDTQIQGTFDARSLKVLHAMKNGAPSTALSDKDKAEIEKNIAKDVLESEKHAQVTFASTSVKRDGASVAVSGTLQVHGVSKPVSFTAKKVDGAWVAEIPLSQPDYGIKPFSAMMGTLKVKPDLKVRVKIPG